MNPVLGLARLVEFGGALLILWHCSRALASLVRSAASDDGLARARRLLAEGVVAALGVITAATLLKSTQLRSWNAIGTFAAVFALRTAVKRTQAWELARLQPNRDSAAR